STLKPTFSLPGDTHQLRGANDVTGGTWHHVVATYDGSYVRIYVDGIQDPNVLVKANAIEPSSFEKGFWIGHGDQPKDRGWSAEWEGQIDEVRISDVVRSAGWIQTQFENQFDPSGFYSVGAEEDIGYSESASINLDTSAPAGVWHATARYSDSSSDVNYRTGLFTRSFIVKRGTSLSLTAPGDAVGDGITTKLVGEQLYVEFELEDALDATLVSGATVSMNWSVSGVPTDVQLNDFGDGRYGKTLNTSDLDTYGRWRIDLETSHPFYSNATDFFYLDLSHRTFMTYAPPLDTPYGDNLEVLLTLKDNFDNIPLTGATISCNGTIVGLPTDHGNGTYLVTIDSTGLSTGEHTFRFTATPDTSYLLSSSIDVQFTYRPVATEVTLLTPDIVEAPWGQQANTSVYCYDVDRAGIGVDGGSFSIDPATQIQTFDEGGGYYSITIDVSSLTPGTYYFNLTFSKLNYQSSMATISITILPHSTTLSVDYISSIPVGTDAYFDVSWLDLNLDSAGIGNGNLSQVSLDWGTGSDSFFTFGFWLDTSGWAVGSYSINVTVNAIGAPRFYIDSYIVIQLEIRKLNVYLSWDPLEPFPNGNDFVMFVYVNVSEPGNPIDGTPITGLDQSYFSATNETGGPYSFKSFSNLGEGVYQITIDSTRFLEGQYKIIVFVDFLPAENYIDSNTPEVLFTYRPILAYLSSPDYPTVTTSFDTNVTVTLSYVDIDHVLNITIGTIASEGASIIWQHLGEGVYEVLIIVQGWDLGAHEVNLTADASGYQAKTLTFQILVQIAYAYARSSVSLIDLPVGDTAVFYADYWDITHDEPIIGATVNHNWTYALSITWTGDQYRIELPSMDYDSLGSYLIMFNFSKGSNYQFGYFNMSIILRTHQTEFRLAGAVEPTSYNAMVNISIYCGDLDNGVGIIESPVSLSVYGDSGLISSTYLNDSVLGNGYYIIRFAATNLGPSGIFELTVYFNWTGPVQKYYDGALVASVRIIGEASDLSLIDSAEPTPYLDNLTYTYLYSELYSGNGISNISAPAGNVFVYVDFVGQSISPSQYTITEDIGNPGYYSIVFNSTIFGKPGVYTMIVYVNWSKGVDPGYGNWTDTVAVRIIPRSTVVNLIPPESTPYGVNATFSFSFDDVAAGTPYSIPNSGQMTISIGLPDYSIIYNGSTRLFHVSFNTSVLGEPLGNRQFTIGVTWIGEPYYANVTGRTVIVNVRFRETEFDYSTISPTPYGDNVTLLLTYTDITPGSSEPIDDGVVTLFNGTQEIPVSEYSFSPIGNGEYVIEFKTSYFTKPGTYSIIVEMTTGHFYYAAVTATRTLSLRHRLTVLLVEPVEETPYNNSLEVVFHYNDVLTLADIGNGSTPTSIRILNGSSWIFNSVWRGTSEDYLLTVQMYNQNLEINREYVLWIEVSYPDSSPFYLSAETFVSFTLRERTTSLELTTSPEPTQYLDNVSFSIYYQDSISLSGIAGATITLTISGIDLVEGLDYVLESPTDGIYYISLNTTTLGAAGTTISLLVRSSWNSTAPYYSTSTLTLSLSVTQRDSIAEILSSTTQVKFLENFTFTISYSDVATGSTIQLSKDQLLIYSEGDLLQIDDFSMIDLGTSYEISINSSALNTGLVSNWNITFYVDWQNNVAPYYADGRASAWVIVVNRVGTIISDTTPTVPIHDNMTLEFTYTDESMHTGISDAIVEFDCLSPSGLVEGVDFWILRDAGNYSILVDTDSLGSTGTFTFSLRLLWNPTLVPFYRNTTTVFLQGSVRLIQAQLTNEDPDPSTVPINDNISVVLHFQDLDHASPIIGAEGSFSVVYKTNASGPTTWSITPISPGVYQLVVDCHDAGVSGTNALIITLPFSDYHTVEIQVPFQIRLRQGELNELPPPSTYFGESTYVIVELVDMDADNAPIDGATLTITWPDIGYTPDYVSIGPGLYNITLTTASLDAGLYTLVVGAQVSDYFISDISVPIQILSITTNLILPQTISDVYWGQDISIWAIFNNTRDDILISGALVVYQLGVLSGNLPEVVADPGNYSVTIDTGTLAVASTYVISITATLNNYVTVTGQLTVNILKLPISLTVVSDAQPDVFKGSGVNITVYVNNTQSNTPLLGSTVEVTWIAQGPQSIILSPVPGSDGYYTGSVDTDDLIVGEYVLTITADRINYVTATTSVSLRIRQISTVVFLDTETSTYGTQTFNWSDTIRIGVYVLAPSLNESYPMSTGLANCTVIWSLSGTGYTGEFLNGSSLGGPGYFYFDFETWDYSASTYTLRITAYPNLGMYAYSSNLTTLIIEPIETSVESTYLSPKIWGWTGWINLTYWDLLFDRGIAGANVLVDWNGSESVFRELANGTYQIFINASLVNPGIYPVSVLFSVDNYKSGTGVFTLNVKEVPTAITAYAPEINQIDDVLNLEVPYGDVLSLVLFYNDTWYNRGIPGATEMTGVILGQSIPDRDYLIIDEIADGNYSMLMDTTRWVVSPNPYRLILNLYVANWSRATIEIHVTIINVPTHLQIEGSTSITLNYGQVYSIWVFYSDAWIGHAGEGIAGASMNATSLDSRFVIVSLNQSDPSRPGWYEIRVLSLRTEGSAIVSIFISKENYDPASEFITISVEPSEFDLLLDRVIIFGVPIGLVIIAGAVLWTRLFSVPKRLREIRGMVRAISKGKIPEPPDNVPSRQEIVADLFNDIAEPLGVSKPASSMPGVAVVTDVPEIEELLIQLSILSKLTIEEFEDFKLDVSKMKLSEQVAFVKEVINQEAIKQGRIDGRPMEEILEESAAKARTSLAGEEIDQVFDREPVEEKSEPIDMEEPEKTPPPAIEFEEFETAEILDESELKKIRKQLVDAGIKDSELETIMEQARELPRELAEELLKSILGKGGEGE
ncbi:MAG: LamG domain-containing protein, partial [Candidatus Thorarchaeota archaeon]